MIPQRITVKLFLKDPVPVHLPDFVPVFHHWIQNRSVEGLLIDVADYKHMQQGPGIVLIGHEADYAIDLSGGRPGLFYRRKRQINSGQPIREQLLDSFRLALLAAQTLEDDPSLKDRLTFRADQIQIGFPDRLRSPNLPETYDRYLDDLRAALSILYPGSDLTLRPSSGDARMPFSVEVEAPGAARMGLLLERVQAARILL